MQLFDEMQQQQFEPNVITYTEWTLQCFDQMRQQGLVPNMFTYIAVSSTCGKCRMP